MCKRYSKSIENVKNQGMQISFILGILIMIFTLIFMSYLNFGLWLGES